MIAPKLPLQELLETDVDNDVEVTEEVLVVLDNECEILEEWVCTELGSCLIEETFFWGLWTDFEFDVPWDCLGDWFTSDEDEEFEEVVVVVLAVTVLDEVGVTWGCPEGLVCWDDDKRGPLVGDGFDTFTGDFGEGYLVALTLFVWLHCLVTVLGGLVFVEDELVVVVVLVKLVVAVVFTAFIDDFDVPFMRERCLDILRGEIVTFGDMFEDIFLLVSLDFEVLAGCWIGVEGDVSKDSVEEEIWEEPTPDSDEGIDCSDDSELDKAGVWALSEDEELLFASLLLLLLLFKGVFATLEIICEDSLSPEVSTTIAGDEDLFLTALQDSRLLLFSFVKASLESSEEVVDEDDEPEVTDVVSEGASEPPPVEEAVAVNLEVFVCGKTFRTRVLYRLPGGPPSQPNGKKIYSFFKITIHNLNKRISKRILNFKYLWGTIFKKHPKQIHYDYN